MKRLQKTVAGEIKCSGVGLHSGQKVNISIKPARVNQGIKFIRKDLPNQPSVLAFFRNVVDTSLATVLGSEGAIVSTIEHLMSALAGMEVDNATVEMDAYEIPIMDGSSLPFVELIKQTGLVDQEEPRHYFVVTEPISLKDGDKSVVIEPSDKLIITCYIDFNHPLVKSQTFSIAISEEGYINEICRARTFGFIQELELLRRFGLAKGGSLDNAVVIDKENVLNKDGLRYHDEFVRHKILDSLGDFSLLGMPVIGHIKIHKSGHAFHHAFLEEFLNQKKCWQTKTLSD